MENETFVLHCLLILLYHRFTESQVLERMLSGNFDIFHFLFIFLEIFSKNKRNRVEICLCETR